MDTRKALAEKTELCLAEQGRETAVYVITKELARGASAIVYDGFFRDGAGRKQAVRIKECYPFSPGITRDAGQMLRPRVSDKQAFEQAKEKMRAEFSQNRALFAAQEAAAGSLQSKLYEQNGTVYLVSACQQGKTLAECTLHSLQECLGVVKSAAAALQTMHENGYLYLDLKPENILVPAGPKKPVQLLDVDSPVRISEKGVPAEQADYRVSYTVGFSAPEHQMGKDQKLGRSTDGYSIGAVLFHLLFGHAPTAADCERDAAYPYDSSRYGDEPHPAAFYHGLTSFFHHTLANSIRDRYPDMAAVTNQLTKLEKLADAYTEFPVSARISLPAFFVGRRQEETALRQFLFEDTAACLFLTGADGIGKSTLVKYVLGAEQRRFHHILYVPFCKSVRCSILSDQAVCIHGVQRSEDETETEYFDRKLRHLRELVKETETVLVLDDFDGEPDGDFVRLLQPEWKLLVISRKNPPDDSYPVLHLGAPERRDDLYRLFEKHRGVPVLPEEEADVEAILDASAGHTLVLELVAKQLAQSRLTLHQAAGLFKTSGFSKITGERVRTEKDFCTGSATVRHLIGAVFSAERESEEKQCLLKALSLFDAGGVPLSLFRQLEQLVQLNDLNELMREGWVQQQDEVLFLHPVIREAILLWPWTERAKEAALQVFALLQRQVEAIPPADAYTCSAEQVRRIKWLSQKEQRQLLLLSDGVLAGCRQVDWLRQEKAYFTLLLETVLHMPKDWAQWIQEDAEYLLQKMPELTDADRFSLYEKLFLIAEDIRKEEYRKQLKRLAKRGGNLEKARYYNIVADFYNAGLAGADDQDDSKTERKQLYKACEKGVQLLKKYPEQRLLCIKLMLTLAKEALCAEPCRGEKAHKLLKKVFVLCREGQLRGTFAERDYLMTCARYYTDAKRKEDTAAGCLQAGMRLAGSTCRSSLDCMDTVMLPAAKICCELGHFAQAERILNDSVKECLRHGDTVPFLRKKPELQKVLLQVYAKWDKKEKGRSLLLQIEREKKETALYGIAAELSEAEKQYFTEKFVQEKETV